MDKETMTTFLSFLRDAGQVATPMGWVYIFGSQILPYLSWLCTFYGLYRLALRIVMPFIEESLYIETIKSFRDALRIGSPGILGVEEFRRTRAKIFQLIEEERQRKDGESIQR